MDEASKITQKLARTFGMRAWFDHKTKHTSVMCIPIDVGIGLGRVGSGLKQGWGRIGAWLGAGLGAGLGQGWGKVFVHGRW